MTNDNGAPVDAVVIERTFDAPPHLVWQMWTDPEHFKAWYGPTGAGVPVADMDVRVGGRRQVCMEVGPADGPTRMWFTGEYLEVVEGQRLVYTESMSDAHGNVLSAEASGMPQGHPITTQVTVELEDVNGGTKLTLTHAGVPADSPGAAGWEMALDALAAHLEKRTV